MLLPFESTPSSELDQRIFDALVPQDHYLRQVLRLVSFDHCHALAEECYCADFGRPAEGPVLLFKLQFLQFQYNLSDREVIAHARVNIAFRFFLGLGLDAPLPHHSLLSKFRSRLGPDKFQAVFDDIIAQARGYGLVKDRLRLKDATHVIANVAVPSTLGLVAQTRDRLLGAVEPFDPTWVAEQRAEVESIRTATADLKDEQRLLRRVNHLRAIVLWVGTFLAGLWPAPTEPEPKRQRLEQAYGCARHLLGDRDDPKKGDRLLSGVDEDARRGKHGDYFDGYMLDILEDADSELITRLHVLPGNGDEGADTAALVREEEQAHGNDVQGVSQDGAGFRGEVLRELQDPEGLNLEVTVPPTAEPSPTGRFTPERFSLEVIDDQEVLRCPAGEQTSTRERTDKDTGYKYRFKDTTCAGCARRGECIAENTKGGRTVIKNDYEKEYQAAREYAKSEEYKEVRREHPRVERKLAEIVRRHGGRRARYRGRGKVLVQFLVTAVVVNVKRMVKLLTGAERAELAGAA
jgi:IS5 family transposase